MTAADRPSVTPRVGDTITNPDQLDALPVGVVMRARNDLLTETGRLASGDRVVWGEGWSDHAAAIEHLAPLTVLFVPGEPSSPSVTDNARAVREAAMNLYRAMRRTNPDAWAEVDEVEDWTYWDDIVRTVQVTLAAGRAETTTDDATQRLARAAYAVDSAHHFHVNSAGRPICTCGFVGDARARTQTEHITAAVLEEYDHD